MRLIDADALKPALLEQHDHYKYRHDDFAIGKCSGIVDAMEMVDTTLTVDALPVVHAQWKDNGNETVSCSRCATWFPKEREPYLLYCGCCGAKMDGKRRDDA